jgi:hypothetical protein
MKVLLIFKKMCVPTKAEQQCLISSQLSTLITNIISFLPPNNRVLSGIYFDYLIRFHFSLVWYRYPTVPPGSESKIVHGTGYRTYAFDPDPQNWQKEIRNKNGSLFQSSKINPYRADTSLPVQLSVLEAEFSLKTPAVITRIDIGKQSIRYIGCWRFVCTVSYGVLCRTRSPKLMCYRTVHCGS